MSSLAKPTRPKWAVTRRSRPAALAAAVYHSPFICAESGTTGPLAPGRRQRADGARSAILQVTHIAGLAHLVRLAAADGDEDAVSVAGVGHVRPAEGGDFRPPQPAHKQQPGDHGVQTAAHGGHLVGLDAAAAPARPVARGEHGRQVRGAERAGLASTAVAGRSAVAGEDSGGPLAGRVRLAGEAGPEPRRGDRRRGRRGGAPRGVELGEVGGQGRVIELLAAEPGVELAEGAGVGAAGVCAHRRVDQAARGRGRRAVRGVGRGDLGE